MDHHDVHPPENVCSPSGQNDYEVVRREKTALPTEPLLHDTARGSGCVWAPAAGNVSLIIGEQSLPLLPTRGGWWQGSNRMLRPGHHYWFAVNGERFPDPRSLCQPMGVHGPSRHVEHTAFLWTDEHWQARPLASAILYELHVGTFSEEGTFDGAVAHLNHLVNLGVTHVELMPVAEFLGNYGWGYDGVFPFAPHHAYGGPDGLKRLVNACHAKGLAVILDVVYNHLGPSGNYLPRFGPYFTSKHKTPWGEGINFDGPHSDEVRRYFCDNALMWLRDYHIDGLRIDAVHAINDHSAIHFLEQLSVEVGELEAALGRHFVLIAESDSNDPRVVRPREIGGFGLDAQWSDDIHHALHTVLTGEREGYYADFGSLSDLATAMTRPYVYDGRHSHHRQRRHGRPAASVSASRFVAYLQNHDQLGNRMKGERICQLVSSERTKIGAALVLLSPYIPLLFQGEEWAASSPFQFFVDFQTEPELSKAVVAGRQKEFAAFGWKPEEVPDPSSPETLRRSKLKWNEIQLPRHADMLSWHRRLIQLRRQISALTTGRLDAVEASCDEHSQWLQVRRGNIAIVCNFAKVAQDIPLEGARERTLLISSKELVSRGHTTVTLEPDSIAVLGPMNESGRGQ
jgi:maltooligosyltrehalose trehalohydrolase